MNDRIIKAKSDFFKYGCSGAILINYQDITGWDNEKSLEVASPLLGGRKIKCGAVLACEEILNELGINKSKEFEDEFIKKNGTVICRELKGIDTGKIIRPCQGCIEDSCTILEEMRKAL